MDRRTSWYYCCSNRHTLRFWIFVSKYRWWRICSSCKLQRMWWFNNSYINWKQKKKFTRNSWWLRWLYLYKTTKTYNTSGKITNSSYECGQVYNVHSDLINEYDSESEFVPRKTLANVEHQYINKKNNSIAALRDMKYQEYSKIIKKIGTNPFFMIFYTPAQKFVYMQNAKRGRIILSNDATGGLI